MPTKNLLEKTFIVIVHYNSAGLLLDCLRSIIATAPECAHQNIIVVDNASTDGTLEAVRKKFQKVSYIYNTHNIGFAAGANIGARRALEQGAREVLFCNPDAVLQKGCVQHLVRVAQQSPGVFAPVISDTQGALWFAGGRIDMIRQRAVHDAPTPLPQTPYDTGYLSGCVLCVHADVFATIGLFDERFFLYYEDADFSLRAQNAGFVTQVVPRARAVHAEQSEDLGEQKIYFLVLAGLLFFSRNTPWWLKPWYYLYTFARRIKNSSDRFFSHPHAQAVYYGFKDYGRAKHTTHFIPDRHIQ